jgi:eukaryotic-like serine/threonine-protein kinase
MVMPKKIGQYEVKAEIGKGAMGDVFLGIHTQLERPVAIKRRHPRLDESSTEAQESAERFLREGKALAKLKHGSIVGIHDLFTHRDTMYMVLEYVDGCTIQELTKTNNTLPPDVVAIIALRLAEALEYAHFHRIIHRDIKPSNIMVSKQGDVKLMDFGIARDESKDLQGLTETGVVVGTPRYLAPEVVLGKRADERSDLYAVGAVMYLCLSGKRIFEGAEGEAMLTMIAAGKFKRLSKFVDDVPRGLIKIVERCLNRRPERRYGSATELRRALEHFLNVHYAVANHAARMVGYLEAVGKMTKEEVEATIDASQLVISGRYEIAPRRPRRVAYIVVAMAIAAAAAAYGLYAQWLPLPH